MWMDDQVFVQAESRFYGNYWEPDRPVVVLGRSNVAETECKVENCANDNVPIVHRAGGGGTVVLFPGCAIISCGLWVLKPYHNDHYFRQINQAVIDTLSGINSTLTQIEQSGISDLSFDGRKCAGTSMFRSRNYLLYQASILIDCNIEMMDRYLKHPSREPGYRNGRSHADFLFGLSEICPDLTTRGVVNHLSNQFEANLAGVLGAEWIDPCVEQVKYIQQKAEN